MAKRFIDADAFTERMRLQYCKDCDNYNGVRCGSCDIDFAFDMVDDAPTADVVEVKHGRWKIRRQFTSIGGSRFKDCICTNCGYNTNFYVDESEMPKFCPNCGAKMDKGVTK